MEGMFPYTESARRKARKAKALETGLHSFNPADPEAAAHPQDPMEFRVMPRAGKKPPAPRRTASPAARAPGSPPRSPVARPTAAATPGARQAAPKSSPARSAPARPAPARPGAPARKAQGSAGVHVTPERLLLETQALDLFGTGKRGHVAICPDCHHEIIKVVCLGTAVRACLECKGVWLPYAVVRDFARDNEWFLQLGPAIQLEIDKRKRST